jgi:hypothetical protein
LSRPSIKNNLLIVLAPLIKTKPVLMNVQMVGGTRDGWLKLLNGYLGNLSIKDFRFEIIDISRYLKLLLFIKVSTGVKGLLPSFLFV